ncbi:hypothetical protein [Staphylococcus edaphicus]|uniref:Phage protein n=1 Tax=Staphylococcus edaphicus TaxID=1955013 RepID=A0A2C6WQV8_9STAP|nr:hypothetical protein [Staphylococcus edaphicus]PHK50769.1 hypothetical protein BTJ66_00245 [Staphylococcus edaphicus]UQW82461.1 hypothetical protein MNY58_05195 [Staphylococcus edaphicus]
MKIKTKKQLNLPQLIEWGFENDVTGSIVSYDRAEAKRIRFEIGILVSIHGDIHKGDTFTVEVEEEITEDTKLDGLVELGDDGAGEDFFFSRGLSINDCKDECTQAFYILNDDLTMTLIWRDGKLVE